MTASKLAYRRFLKSDFWIELSERKKDLIGKCERCGKTDREILQSHHKVYRPNWYDTILEDLEVLCRGCHEEEHGFIPWVERPFDFISEAIEKDMNYAEPGRPLPSFDNFVLAGLMVEDSEDRRKLAALIRNRSGLRMILTSSKMWSSWLSKSQELKSRWWAWSAKVTDSLIARGGQDVG